MLATILKGEVATRATLAIVNTYAQVRSMVRDMEALQTEKAGHAKNTSFMRETYFPQIVRNGALSNQPTARVRLDGLFSLS